MKNIGIRNLDVSGQRILIPKEVRITLGIQPHDKLKIFVEEETIILRKISEELNACTITGESTTSNKALVNGSIILSPDGAKQLVEEIKEKFNM